MSSQDSLSSPLKHRQPLFRKNILKGRAPVFLLFCIVIMFLFGIFVHSYEEPNTMQSFGNNSKSRVKSNSMFSWFTSAKRENKDFKRVPGSPIMGSMTNQTLRAELGRSAWKLLHTMTVKYPVEPNEDEKELMLDYLYSFARLYPCGECARHFRKVLEQYPPNVTDRDSLSLWGCKVHNVVNKRLEKPIYDCEKLQKDYQCGCGDEDAEVKGE